MISNEEIKSLSALLRKHSFLVPDYQRGYEWESSNVTDFHNMLKSIQNTNAQVFLGTLIFKRESESSTVVELVDGQQRVTTVFIYLSILRDLLSELTTKEFPPKNLEQIGRNPLMIVNDLLLNDDKTGFRLKPNELIKSLFNEFVAPAPKSAAGIDRKPMPKKHKNYTKDFRKAYSLIREMLVKELENEASEDHDEISKLTVLDGFLRAISDQLSVLPIVTSSDTEALEIFLTMNTKGLRLGASDIIKSNIMKGCLSSTPDPFRAVLSSEFLNQWAILLDNLESGSIDQAFRHYFLARQKESFRVRELIEITDARLRAEPFGREHNAKTLLDELVDMSANYKQILDAKFDSHQEEGLGFNKAIESINESLLILNKINVSSRIFTLELLSPPMKYSVQQCSQLVCTVERLTMSWQIAGQNAQTLENHFQTLAYQMNKEEVTFASLMSQLTDLFPDEGRVRSELREPINDSTLSRVILYRIHQRLGDPDRQLAYDPQKTEVEHIAPQAETPNWLDALGLTESEEDKINYENIVELLGNKVLLEQSINNSLRQRPFADKKNGFNAIVKNRTYKYLGFKHSSVHSTKEVADKNSDWGQSQITQRTNWLIDCFWKIFGPSLNTEDLLQYSQWVD